MNKKLRTAAKRISAIGASALLLSPAVTANLGNYPENFVSGSSFVGSVVVGASADAMDTTAANAIINDLKSYFSGDTQRVKITYMSEDSGSTGKKIEFAESGDTWNYGESNQDVRNSKFDDDDDSTIFANEETFKNGYSDQDYSEELYVSNGAFLFEHALRDDVEDDISSHIYVKDMDNLMNYVFSIETLTDVGTKGASDEFIGKDLTILGQDYTITEVSFDNVTGLDKLTVIGGANKVALGEGDSTTVEFNGKSYEVTLNAVDENDVQVTVNGQTKVIEQYDTDTVAGVEIAVTEILNPSRNNVQGFAELVVGGNEIALQDGKTVKINDEDIDSMYDGYLATVHFSGDGSGGWEGFNVTYGLQNEEVLNDGDSWTDRVFNAFSIMYEGMNDVSYEELEIAASSSSKLKVSGKLESGDSFSKDVALLTDDNDANSNVKLIGSNSDDAFLVVDFDGNNALDPTALNASAHLIDTETGLEVTATGFIDGVDVSAAGSYVVGNFNVTSDGFNNVTISAIDLTGNHAYGLRFLVGTPDDQSLYEIGSYTSSGDETDFKELLQGKDKDNVDTADIDDLDNVGTATVGTTGQLSALSGMTSKLAFANEALLDFANVAVHNLSASTSYLTFSFDSGDVNADDESTGGDIDKSDFNVTLEVDTGDNEFDVKLTPAEFSLASGAEADVSVDDDNTQEYVNPMGVKVIYDSEDYKKVKIMVPDKQVEAKVYLVTGTVTSGSTMTVTVDEDEVDAKKAELESDGYTIVDTENVESSDVSFDITTPKLDTNVSGMDDMIVVGGPAVNAVARKLLGISSYTIDQAGVLPGEAVIRYFADSNSVLVYGYEKEDTMAAAEKLVDGGLTGSEVSVN
ncbi:hypothetical protein H6501_00485 [Candidatus Woesearchaeota archaeon]|nr:hypothetical protein [Nanoarchaeota archaeon]MCB9370056.1 hypothetical protein [Candidatus Woesearchaeota archaeon]USN44586.1 MAG: hypothetical protein H6500_01955 [Candidatus Woesearchaeota archaeon]